MSLKGLLNQDITIYVKTALNKYGRESYNAGTSAKARVQLTNKTRLLPNQQTVIVTAIVYVEPSVSVNTGDKIVFNSEDYKVYGKYSAVDGSGNTNHLKLELTKWA